MRLKTEKEDISKDEDLDLDMDEEEEGQTKIDEYLSRVESSSDDSHHSSCYSPKKGSQRGDDVPWLEEGWVMGILR